jgi:recombinational DNA repair protein RecR
MDTDTLAQLTAALRELAQTIKENPGTAHATAQLTRIAGALEDLADLETHRLHHAAIKAEQNHKSPSLTKALLDKHPCRRCTDDRPELR